jgi:hypothetical protein
MGLFDEKTEGQKSRDTVSLRYFFKNEVLKSKIAREVKQKCPALQ